MTVISRDPSQASFLSLWNSQEFEGLSEGIDLSQVNLSSAEGYKLCI